MTFEQPPRLKDSDEFGSLLRTADPAVTPERLAANAAAVRSVIASGATTFALWKLIVPFLLLLALGVVVVVTVTGNPSGGEATVVAAVPIDAGPDAALAQDAAELAVAEDAAELATTIDAAPERTRPVAIRVAAAADDAGIDAPPPSDLPEQIRIYEDARAAGRRGELAAGLALLAELLRRFPSTPLRAEAELTRAELLARADRLDEAAPALEALAADPVHRGRRGELLRTLGDLYRRHGDCARALVAYNRALAERIRERDRVDIERGRDRCMPK